MLFVFSMRLLFFSAVTGVDRRSTVLAVQLQGRLGRERDDPAAPRAYPAEARSRSVPDPHREEAPGQDLQRGGGESMRRF